MNRKDIQENTPKGRYFLQGLTFFCAGAALIAVYYILFHSAKLAGVISTISDILMPVLFGFVLAYVLIPVLNFIEGKIIIPLLQRKTMIDVAAKKNKIRAISVFLTAVISIFVVYFCIDMIVGQIVPSIQEIILNFDVYADNGIAYINSLLEDNPSLRTFVNNMIEKYAMDFDGWLNNTLMPKISSLVMSLSLSLLNVLAVLWDGIIGFILSIYILSSKDVFSGQAKKIIYSAFSNKTANDILQDVRFVHKTFTGFITGKVIDSIIIGIICFIGTTIIGTPYAALVSLIIGVTNVIPFFGPFLGAIPCSILVLVVSPTQPLNVVYFVIFILLLQQVDGNIIGPKILGDSTGLSSFWVIFAITLFGGVFGVFGMIIGVPTFAVIFAMLRRKINERLNKKGLPIDRDKYAHIECVNENNEIIENIIETKSENSEDNIEDKENKKAWLKKKPE